MTVERCTLQHCRTVALSVAMSKTSQQELSKEYLDVVGHYEQFLQ